ncbi:DUF4190 domain-containing protein [Demequina sp. NBRC 110051]|uniref:DUF4190 domain-containing protein n=1 Tax=Demequina sp. NBRC 110051 TaxID=1570340 RepID=UPI0009FBC346|nr:DUF4190 domain-containing protein [Demequina sp. NBRC 110051]
MPDPRHDDTTMADHGAPTEVLDVSEARADTGADDGAADGGAGSSGSWMGPAAWVTGAIGLWHAAIPLGHLGIAAAKRGDVSRRGFAVAGTILGYVGLLITALLLWVVVRGPLPETVDAYAHHDVVEVGNAVGAALAADESLPAVEAAASGYVVGETAVTGLLETQRTVSLTPVAGTGWCVQLDYVGGTVGSWSFDSAEGVTEGGTCAAG